MTDVQATPPIVTLSVQVKPVPTDRRWSNQIHARTKAHNTQHIPRMVTEVPPCVGPTVGEIEEKDGGDVFAELQISAAAGHVTVPMTAMRRETKHRNVNRRTCIATETQRLSG